MCTSSFNPPIPVNRKLVVIGYGVVGKCVLDMLRKELKFSSVTVLDRKAPTKDLMKKLPDWARYEQVEINQENYEEILSRYLDTDDVCCNLSVLESQDLLIWCQKNDVLYLDTSGEEWENPDGDHISFEDRNKQEKLTLYGIQMRQAKKIKELKEAHPDKTEWPTAAIYHGMNPGLVNQCMKRGLFDIADAVLKLPEARNREAIMAAKADRNFAELARALGVKVIHVSERDTQVSSRPRFPGEFASTWSVEGFLVELEQYSELSLGTHEQHIPADAKTWEEGPQMSIALGSKGATTRLFSWVPSGPTLGFLTPHDESLTMGNFLTVRDDQGRLQYRPTVLFSYMPCDLSVVSIHEFIMQGYDRSMKEVFLGADDITGGKDEVGVLLLGHQLGAWWTGSTMSNEDAQRIAPGHTATTIQVAAGVISALHWIVKNPREGVCIPEDMPHEEILDKAIPYLTPFVSQHSDFDPLDRPILHFFDHEDKFGPIDSDGWMPTEEHKWQLPLFLHGSRRLKPSPYYVPQENATGVKACVESYPESPRTIMEHVEVEEKKEEN